MKKKGQVSTAPGAANLIMVIILLLSLYILFVPPAERERILEGGAELITETVAPLTRHSTRQ